eukprot:TRINITY_DN2962_c0_g1_i2.p1 TRINITY_DN2962_c0_g1~~TRINITY_DN2962_c0_g1_i2.p1  ORF type:complete len:334 (-),score=106.68 TRINITY_DN2962_c0_g1_i2:60-1061(-)
MLSTLTDGIQFVGFILQWFIGWLVESPHVLVIILLLGWGTIFLWRSLNKMTMPAMLTSPKISLMLLLGLFIVATRGYTTNQQLLGLQNDLDNADWRIRQGSQHRVDLLYQIETEGWEKKQGLGGEGKVEEQEANPLDGCLHVFLAIGSGSVLPIRKLYEPNNFPLSPMQTHFDKVFGNGGERNIKDICTVTIEPNATLALEKTALSKSYSTCGIRVLVDDKAVRIATYITAVVAKRNLPASASSLSPGVVMHVGGPQSAQMQIIPDLLVTGALGQVDSLVLEGRGDDVYRHMVDSIVALGELTNSEGIEHKFEVEQVDDQTYPEYDQVQVMKC